jgi:hypothetical protein
LKTCEPAHELARLICLDTLEPARHTPNTMTVSLATLNSSILRTINSFGFRREGHRAYRALSFGSIMAIVASTGFYNSEALERVREALDALCVPGQFTGAALVKLDGDIYAQRIRYSLDYHRITERDDLMFAVRRGDCEISAHSSLGAAFAAADAADHAQVMGCRVAVRAVDATYHGAHYNAQGEAICAPEPR